MKHILKYLFFQSCLQQVVRKERFNVEGFYFRYYFLKTRMTLSWRPPTFNSLGGFSVADGLFDIAFDVPNSQWNVLSA